MLMTEFSNVYGHLPRGRCGLKFITLLMFQLARQSPSARKVWIEIKQFYVCNTFIKSPSARKVWIEIHNLLTPLSQGGSHLPRGRCGLKSYTDFHDLNLDWSPSARKVWIEIKFNYKCHMSPFSHLPRGRCGLKFPSLLNLGRYVSSPSARKVWIEI